MTLVIAFGSDTFSKWIGTIISLIIIATGYAITSKWSGYIFGEQQEELNSSGSFG